MDDKTLLRGTFDFTGFVELKILFNLTFCTMLYSKFLTKAKYPEGRFFESFSRRTQWDVESKAFLKSIATIETARIYF